MSSKILRWFLLCTIITILYGLVYHAVLQNYRQSANDPQIQLSEDLANQDARVLPGQPVDIAHSLATFIIIFDNSKQPLSSTAQLNGTVPTPPSGVFDYVKTHGQTRITWQPQPDVRTAIVVTKSKSGFVLVGRSLREVEKREANLQLSVALAWVVSMIVSLFYSFI